MRLALEALLAVMVKRSSTMRTADAARRPTERRYSPRAPIAHCPQDSYTALVPHAGANGVSLYYEEHGTGDPIVCIHGTSSSAAVWGAIVLIGFGVGLGGSPPIPGN